MARPETKRRSKQGVRTPLSRNAVISAGIRLADRSGIGPLSMRKIATELGVEAMSLYHHVANKEEILDGMVDAVFGEIAMPSGDAHWKVAVRARSISLREVLLAHRWAIGLMDSRTNPGPATLRHHESVLKCLRSGGFSMPMAAHAFSAIDSYIYGFVLQEVSLPFESTEEIEELGDAMLQQMPEDEYPFFMEMMTEYYMKPEYSYADEFEFGLDLVLSGFERLVKSAD